MSRNPNIPAEQPDLGREDYIRALEVIAEVSGIVVEEKALALDEKVLEDAEAATLKAAPERIVDEAEKITHDTGVLLPKFVIGDAVRLTHKVNPESSVKEAEAVTFRNRMPSPEELVADAEKVLKNAVATERPRRPNDLELEDLVPGTRIVVYDEVLGSERPTPAGHEVIVSWPYEKKDDRGGAKSMVVKARKVEDHSTDETPLDPEEGVREVQLDAWGITSNSLGFYRQNRFIESYVDVDQSGSVPGSAGNNSLNQKV